MQNPNHDRIIDAHAKSAKRNTSEIGSFSPECQIISSLTQSPHVKEQHEQITESALLAGSSCLKRSVHSDSANITLQSWGDQTQPVDPTMKDEMAKCGDVNDLSLIENPLLIITERNQLTEAVNDVVLRTKISDVLKFLNSVDLVRDNNLDGLSGRRDKKDDLLLRISKAVSEFYFVGDRCLSRTTTSRQGTTGTDDTTNQLVSCL